jgi:hypothetical protein
MYLFFPQRYHFIQDEKGVTEAERMERNIKPDNALEAHVVKPTDIHEHLATLYMITVELNLRTVVELGDRWGSLL